MALTTASASGCGSFAISAAISSVSEVDESFTSSPSRSSDALTRLPLWPTATVRAVPCWTIGCAFTHLTPPVVE